MTNEKELLERFKQEVYPKNKEMGEDCDWFSLAVGFFLALNVGVERAHELAMPACQGKTDVPRRRATLSDKS